MMKAIQGPVTESGQLLIRTELAAAVTKGQCSAFSVNAATGALEHRSYVLLDNKSQNLVWGIATESGTVGEQVTFVLKGVVYAILSNTGAGNIAVGDKLTRRNVAGGSNAVVKAATGEVVLASANQATTGTSDDGYISWDGLQARYQVG
jgi:hypothetical protein